MINRCRGRSDAAVGAHTWDIFVGPIRPLLAAVSEPASMCGGAWGLQGEGAALDHPSLQLGCASITTIHHLSVQGLGFDLDLWRRLLSTATLVPTEGFSPAPCSMAFPGWWVFPWEPRWWG